MHVLFVHQNFPAQFGHIASYLVRNHGFECTFVSERPPGNEGGIRRLQYKLHGGATKSTHYCSRSFENFIWHSHGVYETMKANPDVRPDLIVGHSGFGSTLFLADLYQCPIVNYFEYYYRSTQSDMDFRKEFPTTELDRLRVRGRNAMLLSDLENCDAGYSPTRWQRSLFPATYRDKIETIFDGIDTTLWKPRREGETLETLGGQTLPKGKKIVTYVSRGFESMRGFDIFMKIAKRIYQDRSDVHFVCVGSDRVCYGGDNRHIQASSFREHVLSQDSYDLSRFLFTGMLPTRDLAMLLAHSDLHIYLTVPFVLSWSLMDSLASGCTVLASATPPVQEMIEPGVNGLLADFYDVDSFVRQAHEVLNDPASYRSLGQRGVEMVERDYSLTQVLPRMLGLYDRVIKRGRPSP
ncbi:glycosyltransferase [bacterium]|jgi:glycosyltransferase involved in cell wall biosynthesis|nr:glycosyltransferase [bacterium]